MVVFNDLSAVENIRPTAVALGNFDGVHLGHQKLIENCVAYAKDKSSLMPAVFTFSNHPKDILPGRKPVKNILYRNEKRQIIEDLGMEYMFEVPFTEEIMNMSPSDFVHKILVDKLNAKAVFCGFNFRFGKGGEGDPSMLKAGLGSDIEVFEMEPFCINGNVVSSSLIRTLVASGQVDQCKTYMGRNYEISGEVVVGNRLGKSLGFPTSNLVIDESMVTPPNGVYITYCNYNGVRYPSVTNVGHKPTVGDFSKNVETHIFNFDKLLYGKNIIVEFLKKTRDEVKFDDIEDLKEQIVRDCRQARAFHGI